MNNPLFVGVDGGASKTDVVVLDIDSRQQGDARGPAATLNGPIETAWLAIEQTAMKIAAFRDTLPTQRHLVVGIAGTEIAHARHAFVAATPPYGTCVVHSDADIACAGAHALADGAIVAIGTGLVGWLKNQGQDARAGGWGFPHDDRGAGAWLGLKAVQYAFRAIDGRAPPDPLAESVLAAHDHDPMHLSAWACAATARDFASIVPLIVQVAQAGSPVAERLLNRAATHVADLAHALVGERQTLALAVTGGMAPVLTPRLDPVWRRRLVSPRFTPAHGAALMARQRFLNGYP